METALRLEAVERSAFDARIARLGGGRLTRSAAALYLESERAVDDVTHQLALAGIRVSRCAGVPDRAPSLRPAIAFDLTPLDDSYQAVDVVELRRIPLCEASDALMHRRLPWQRSSRAARDECLRLLREEDAVMGWRRMVWCSVAAMRVVRTRVRLRPVVFDRAALEQSPSRWTYASAGAVERWAFA
ncbi:MAG TPA: hypothetical protein VMQ78_05615 [Candidatus Limnocylindria bacterium]|nr:hypothetical protein [Candidatus Limnocylindria bacterium]